MPEYYSINKDGDIVVGSDGKPIVRVKRAPYADGTIKLHPSGDPVYALGEFLDISFDENIQRLDYGNLSFEYDPVEQKVFVTPSVIALTPEEMSARISPADLNTVDIQRLEENMLNLREYLKQFENPGQPETILPLWIE